MASTTLSNNLVNPYLTGAATSYSQDYYTWSYPAGHISSVTHIGYSDDEIVGREEKIEDKLLLLL